MIIYIFVQMIHLCGYIDDSNVLANFLCKNICNGGKSGSVIKLNI